MLLALKCVFLRHPGPAGLMGCIRLSACGGAMLKEQFLTHVTPDTAALGSATFMLLCDAQSHVGGQGLSTDPFLPRALRESCNVMNRARLPAS